MGLMQDVRFGLRMMVRAPVQAIVLIATLALVLAANAVVFCIADLVLIRPLPQPRAERLVTIVTDPSSKGSRLPVTYPDYEDWVRESKSFENIAVFRAASVNIAEGGVPERVGGLRATSN